MHLLITRILKKEFNHAKGVIAQKDAHTTEELQSYLGQLENNLEESILLATETKVKQFSDARQELKKKNKALHTLKNSTEKEESQWTKEKELYKRQIEKQKIKIQVLLKNSHKYQNVPTSPQKEDTSEEWVQCDFQNELYETKLDSIKKQNSSLSNRIIQLQSIISSKNQDIEAANILIQELIKQLDTNLSDRQTGRSYDSRTASDIQDESKELSEIQFSDLMEENSFNQRDSNVSDDSANCGTGRTQTDDCSTVDGSNAATRDFALPEWLQGQEYTPQQNPNDSFQQPKLQMWPQLLWSRVCFLLGFSQQN